jgi:hypothetical protein
MKIMIAKHLKDTQDLPSEEKYATTDLGLASSLVVLGYELHTLERTINPKKARFIFRRIPTIETSANNYWNDHLELNARTLFDAQKMIKNRLYSDETIC